MFIKIANTIFRLKKYPRNDDGIFNHPNHPTVFIDTREQSILLDNLFEAKMLKKERKISGYYFTSCFDYVYKNFKIITIKSKMVNGKYERTASFYSKALNEKWSGRYKTSLYTISDLRQMVPLRHFGRSMENINKFKL